MCHVWLLMVTCRFNEALASFQLFLLDRYKRSMMDTTVTWICFYAVFVLQLLLVQMQEAVHCTAGVPLLQLLKLEAM